MGTQGISIARTIANRMGRVRPFQRVIRRTEDYIERIRCRVADLRVWLTEPADKERDESW
jgi:hypothetical protein